MTTKRNILSESSKNSSSERGTINGVKAVKDGSVTATTPSNSRYRPTYCRFLDKQASPYW